MGSTKGKNSVIVRGLTPRLTQWLIRQKWLVWGLPALLALGVCLVKVTGPALWTDELATWSVATRPLDRVFALLGNVDAVLGGYYLFMHAWVSVFGDSVLALRIPSVLAMAIAAGLLAALGRRLFNAKTGLIAGLLFAALPVVTRFGQEARVYAIVLALVVAATLVLVIALDRNKPVWWVGYAISIVVLGAAHIVAVMVLFAHGVVVWGRWRTNRASPVGWFCAVGGALFALAPVIWGAVSQRDALNWVPKPRLLALADLPNTELFGTGAVAGILLGLALIAAVTKRAGQWTLPLVIWGIVPPAVLFVLSRLGGHLWNQRYLLFILPAFILLAAVLLAQLAWRQLLVVGLVMTFLALPQQQALRRAGAHARMDGRAVANLISAAQRPGDVVVYAAVDVWAGRATLDYYLAGRDRPKDVLAEGSAADAAALQPRECEEIARCLGNAPVVWVVRWGQFETDPLHKMEEEKAEVLTESYELDQTWQRGDYTIARYLRR